MSNRERDRHREREREKKVRRQEIVRKGNRAGSEIMMQVLFPAECNVRDMWLTTMLSVDVGSNDQCEM